ncbi:hypothetical protein [Sphingomonas sp.]|uniref:hypothetical protein n=1 Tax=Sphingomonas sp. TaxID=28214 RepID=UPI00286E3DF0|nr:hypothetical protein [Sphingomonas sp.]
MTARPARRAGRWLAGAAVVLAALLAAIVLARGGAEKPAPRPPAERPTLLLLTSLPLLFGETLSLEGGGSPALTALETRYRVVPIAVARMSELRKGSLLLMAHPLAQPAEALVELDAWVRRGGRVVLLADPALEWDSALPLGDRRRPPPTFADTGLLAHWGLRLDAPDERGPRQGEIGGRTVMTVSPGSLTGRGCALETRGLVAHCRLGKGQATIIADADFLNLDDLDGPTADNLPALLAELSRIEKDRP